MDERLSEKVCQDPDDSSEPDFEFSDTIERWKCQNWAVGGLCGTSSTLPTPVGLLRSFVSLGAPLVARKTTHQFIFVTYLKLFSIMESKYKF